MTSTVEEAVVEGDAAREIADSKIQIDALPSHVLITADIFRVLDKFSSGDLRWHQWHNVLWLQQIIAGSLAANPDIRVSILAHDALGLTVDNFGPSAGTVAEKWWVEQVSSPLQPELEGLIRTVVAGKVVVAFELPPNLRTTIANAARLLIELEIAPVRFCDDLFLQVTCEDQKVQNIVRDATIKDREIYWNIGLLKSRLCTVRDTTLPAGRVALLAGQTSADRSLISEGRLLSFADYVDQIAKISDGHDIVLLSPHQYLTDEIPGLRSLLAIPGLRVTTANSYRLLASGRIETLVSISSSLLVEAPYFGIEAIRLGPAVGAPVLRIRLATLGGPIADVIADAAGFALPECGKWVSQDGCQLQQVLGFNWAASYIDNPRPALPAFRIEKLPMLFSPADPAWSNGLVYGWHQPEAWGTWCTSFGVLSFGWPDERGDSVLCILDVVSLGTGRPTQVGSIWCDGLKLAEAAVPPGVTVPLAFEVMRPTRPGPVQLWLVCDPLFYPAKSIPGSVDHRRLGLGLVGVAFH